MERIADKFYPDQLNRLVDEEGNVTCNSLAATTITIDGEPVSPGSGISSILEVAGTVLSERDGIYTLELDKEITNDISCIILWVEGFHEKLVLTRTNQDFIRYDIVDGQGVETYLSLGRDSYLLGQETVSVSASLPILTNENNVGELENGAENSLFSIAMPNIIADITFQDNDLGDLTYTGSLSLVNGKYCSPVYQLGTVDGTTHGGYISISKPSTSYLVTTTIIYSHEQIV